MLETSRDLLYMVIAFCVLWFTIFLCWLLYYLIGITKNLHGTLKNVKQKIAMVDEIFKTIKEKVDNSAAYVGLIANAAMKIVDYVKEKKQTKTARQKNKSA